VAKQLKEHALFPFDKLNEHALIKRLSSYVGIYIKSTQTCLSKPHSHRYGYSRTLM